jgi:replicative DNA helicase
VKRRENIGIIGIDYLQRIRAPGMQKYNNRPMEVAHVSNSLKALAKSLNVPVIVNAQLNRSAESREDRRPMLSDLRESGAIEQDADVVMLLYREEHYVQDSEKKGIAEITLAKNRSGPTGTVELAFLKHYARFENLAARPSR